MPQFDLTTWAIVGCVAFLAWTNRAKLLGMLKSKSEPDAPEDAHAHDRACLFDSLASLRKRAKKANNPEAVKATELLASIALDDEEEAP